MMWQILFYAVAVAAALGVVGAGLEYVAVRRGVPRRPVWVAVMALSILWPAVALWRTEPRVAITVPGASDGGMAVFTPVSPGTPVARVDTLAVGQATNPPVPALAAPASARTSSRDWSALVPADRILAQFWVLASALLLLHQAGASWLLRRRASGWRQAAVRGESVLVSEVMGPALLGVLRPRVVVPRWVLDEPAATQALILAHERQHLRARDPLLLWAGTLVVALVPWNLPLWWQLRRLRCAIELDCDARVLRAGAEPDAYGEVLLTVTRRVLRAPAGALAMSDPASALERRIRHLVPVAGRFMALRAIAAVTLAVTGISAALALQAPAVRTTVVRASDAPLPVRMPVPAGAVPAWALPAMAAAAPVVPQQGAPTAAAQAQPVLILKPPFQSVRIDPWRAWQQVHNVGWQQLARMPQPLPGEDGDYHRLVVLLTEDGRVERAVVERVTPAMTPVGKSAQQIATFIAARLDVDMTRIGVVGTTSVYRQDYPSGMTEYPRGLGVTTAAPPAVPDDDELVVEFAWPRRAGEVGPSLLPANERPSLRDALRNAIATDVAVSQPVRALQETFDAFTALAMVERHIPDAFSSDATAGSPVIVLSAQGEFVRAGRDRTAGAGPGPRLMTDSQVLGLRVGQVSWRTVRNAAGANVEVLFAWQESAQGDR